MDASDVTNDRDLGGACAAERPPSPPREPAVAVGQVLRDRYVLKSRLGTGEKGDVFRAQDRFRATLPDLHQDVALKIVHSGGVCPEQTFADLRSEFYDAQLLSHRNVLNVYELDRDGDVVFFTMELLEGELLSDLIERLRPAAMGRAQAWQLIHQLCEGLTHAHERGIVHGNLKPQDIFVTREGELRILNFGRARGVAASQAHLERGDPAASAYASCEQLEGRRADPRDDLYALACICYEILAAAHPFDLRLATVARDYRAVLLRPRGLTGRQWRALQQGLSWHRAARSISVDAWMHRLMTERLQKHSLTPLEELAQPSVAQPKIRWRVAALFLVATLAGAAMLAQRRPMPAPRTTAPSSAVAVAQNTAPAPALDEPPAAAETPASVAPSKEAIEEPRPSAEAPRSNAEALRSNAEAARPNAEALRPDVVAGAISSVISVAASRVASDDHFAEIRLHRNALKNDSEFTWWTEPATAKPGVDYVPQAAAIQTFPNGYRATRLYVRLLPQPLRSQRSYFYVAIAKLGHQQGPGTVIRRQVWLPASADLQAQR